MSANMKHPRYGEEVIVHCKHFTCLGVFLRGNKWRSAFTNELLDGVTGWSFLDSTEVHPAAEADDDAAVSNSISDPA